jgi:hypothetical protein
MSRTPAVHQRAGGAAHLRGGGEQLAPGRDARRVGAGEHRNVARVQAVDQGDLEFVRVGAGDVAVHLHELRGAGAADHHARLVERADARGQGLIHQADRIEAVGQHGGEQRANIGKRRHFGSRFVATRRMRRIGAEDQFSATARVFAILSR